MIECYNFSETHFRSYHGWEFENDECVSLLQNDVKKSLLDKEEQEKFLEELSDLAGLPSTGFDSTRILADIQAIETEDPIDLRAWRIGEAFAEVVLENHLSVRFHWNELRDARNPKGNKTGADLVGFIEINDDVLFLFGETKTSSETANRPPQVMTGAKGIEDQLRDLYSNSQKRMILIRYLASKVRNLDAAHPFRVDYEKAKQSYYLNSHPNFQLIGVLIRDVPQDEADLRASYARLRTIIAGTHGIKLIACYIPIQQNQWDSIIETIGTSGE